MTFGGGGTPSWDIFGGLDAAATEQIINVALDHGVNLIDTADFYATGESESMIGEILGQRRRSPLC